jgi:hypothetical protein
VPASGQKPRTERSFMRDADSTDSELQFRPEPAASSVRPADGGPARVAGAAVIAAARSDRTDPVAQLGTQPHQARPPRSGDPRLRRTVRLSSCAKIAASTSLFSRAAGTALQRGGCTSNPTPGTQGTSVWETGGAQAFAGYGQVRQLSCMTRHPAASGPLSTPPSVMWKRTRQPR